MITTCWSVKGGVGTTVVAALLALCRAREDPDGVLAIDLHGDLAVALGAEPPGVGLGDWLAAEDVPLDALGRLATEVAPGLRLIGPGHWGEVAPGRLDLLLSQIEATASAVFVDAGVLDARGAPAPSAEVGRRLASESTHSWLVTRPCYLALLRAQSPPLRPSGVVVVVGPERRFTRHEIEANVGAPVIFEMAVDPAIARGVDSGLLQFRFPRSLHRALRKVA